MLAAGCGTLHAGQADTLSAAVTKTTAETSRVATTMTMHVGGIAVSFTRTGVFDFAHSRGMLTTSAPIGVTELIVPPKVYIKFAGGSDMTLPHGKTWVEVSGLPAGATASVLEPFSGGASPADLLASLTAIAGSERTLGPGTVRGVPVTGFRVNIDPAKAAAKLPAWERAGFIQSFGKRTIPADVWVDGQNQVRRLTLTLRMPGGKTGSNGMPPGSGVVQSTDFYDFGVPVKVSAPPAAQVVSMSQALGGPISIGSSSIVISSASSAPSMSAQPVPPLPMSAPPVSGSLTPAQASAAGQAVAAFWAALGRNDPAAVARTVLPVQRSCVTANLQGAPKFTVKSFRIVSVKPAGSGRATVWFTVTAKLSFGGQELPAMSPAGEGAQWFAAAERSGHWYVDTSVSSELGVVGGGPCS
jgi:hypothetical protein